MNGRDSNLTIWMSFCLPCRAGSFGATDLTLDDVEEEVGRAAAAEQLAQFEAAVHRLDQVYHSPGEPPHRAPGGEF